MPHNVQFLALQVQTFLTEAEMEPGLDLLELSDQEKSSDQEKLPDQEKARPERPPFWKRPKVQRAVQICGALTAICLIVFLIFYIKFARMIDRRLAEGPFAETIAIYAAPRTIAPGYPMVREDLITRLRRSGYSSVPDSPNGWFREHGTAVDILPAGREPARIELGNGKITRIFSLRDGHARGEYQIDPQLIANVSENREKRTLVRFQEIPRRLVEAITSIEDKRFFQHSGFDPFRIVKAAYVDLRDGRKQQGASTLSMQLARSLWLDPGKRWKRKLAEMLITLHLEEKLSKQQIFESYANQVYLGRRGTFSIHGFGEAAHAYFAKDLSEVDAAEAALLAGLVQRPSYYNPTRYPERARERRDVVLYMMLQNGYLDNSTYLAALNAPVKIAPQSVDPSSAPYFAALVQDELQEKLGDDGKRNRLVFTTLDADLQQAAEEAVRIGMENVDRQLRGRKRAPDQPQVALIALDPATGEIKALAGGRNYGSSQINHAIALRQPGSVFKPFVYTAAIASALEGGSQLFTPSTILHDDPDVSFNFDRKVYQPGNFHDNYMGDVTLRTALAHSLNVATVSLAQQVGFGKVVEIARRAGLNNRIRATPAVALGAYETTPLEIAGAYTMFANQGVRLTPATISEVRTPDGALVYRHSPDARQALDPRINYLMVDLLQEVLRSGTGAGVRGRGFTLPAAGKTGTSHDGWFAGFTTRLLCVVWVGFDDNSELHLEGARSALPIWTEFMKRAAQFRPYGSAGPFPTPAGITSLQICADSGLRADAYCPKVRTEKFIAGTAPAAMCGMHSMITFSPLPLEIR